VRSRLYAESQIERRIAAELRIARDHRYQRFKRVNDEHGHLVGDELLKQFASELRSACRSTDVIARWGGDEFILVLDCGLREAARRWTGCGNGYSAATRCREAPAHKKLKVDASIGLAETVAGEAMKACAGPSGCGDVQGQGCFPRNGNRCRSGEAASTNETRLKAWRRSACGFTRHVRRIFASRFLL